MLMHCFLTFMQGFPKESRGAYPPMTGAHRPPFKARATRLRHTGPAVTGTIRSVVVSPLLIRHGPCAFPPSHDKPHPFSRSFARSRSFCMTDAISCSFCTPNTEDFERGHRTRGVCAKRREMSRRTGRSRSFCRALARCCSIPMALTAFACNCLAKRYLEAPSPVRHATAPHFEHVGEEGNTGDGEGPGQEGSWMGRRSVAPSQPT